MPRLSMKKMNKKVAAKKSVRRSKTAKGGKRGKSKRTINKCKKTKGGGVYCCAGTQNPCGYKDGNLVCLSDENSACDRC